jgi:hypothetical protein
MLSLGLGVVYVASFKVEPLNSAEPINAQICVHYSLPVNMWLPRFVRVDRVVDGVGIPRGGRDRDRGGEVLPVVAFWRSPSRRRSALASVWQWGVAAERGFCRGLHPGLASVLNSRGESQLCELVGYFLLLPI